jgi:hypothetical protein
VTRTDLESILTLVDEVLPLDGPNLRAHIAELESQLKFLSEAEALRTALRKYGRHLVTACLRKCICGFESALEGTSPAPAPSAPAPALKTVLYILSCECGFREEHQLTEDESNEKTMPGPVGCPRCPDPHMSGYGKPLKQEWRAIGPPAPAAGAVPIL